MYGSTDVLEKTAASSAASPYRGVKGAILSARKSSSVTPAKSDNTIWLDCVSRIRETQDQSAFAELFSHFAPRIKSFLMKSGADEGLAEECSQEVMVTVWHKAHLFDPGRASVATWIFTIARNKKIDALRRASRPVPEDLPWQEESDPDAHEALEMQQESDRLARAIEELPEKQKDIVKRAFYGDLSHQELADETGLPLGTIKSRIRLALERMRHNLS
jgi:RNA polymerase sigma-70 factor (ECF subfamily)